MSAITIMNEDEVQHAESPWSEPGFGCVQTTRGNLPVKALDVSAKISGLVSQVTVRQTYVNRYAQPLEATYIFPLPDRGAVGDFKMIVGGRVIDGALKERGQARREYQQAIEQGHRASIVEEERPDTFTMRVGNIDAGEEVTIEFTVTGPLIFADGEATFRFPLVVAPRYIPGKALSGGNVGDGVGTDTDAVPDASRITPPVLLPGFPNAIQLSLSAQIDAGDLPVKNVRSSLHAIALEQSESGHRIEIRPGEKVNRDFILRFDVAASAIQTGLTYTRDQHGGTFMATLVPPTQTEGADTPRDIVFVLDRSGSMSGWKMVAARRALGRMLDTLTPDDRFQVIVFDNVSTKFGHKLIDGSNRNRYRAIEDLSKVEARGGTEMTQPIFEGLDMLSGGYEDRRRMLVLVTDGQVGNEQQIVKGVQQRMKNVRIFTVGIDQAVNAGFLNRLADVGGGRCELVESEQRLDSAMDRIHRTIDTPVLTGLSVSLDGVECARDTVTPEREPDLFAGAPVMVFGRFQGDGTPQVEFQASKRDGSSWTTNAKGRETSSNGITAIWARQRVRAMEDEYAARGSDPALAEKITNLSLKFGVLCRFTSWVAVDSAQKIESAGDLRQVVQPVEQPAGWANQGPAGSPMARMAPAAPSVGGGGFNQSSYEQGSGFGAAPPAPQAASYSSQADFDDSLDLRSFADAESAPSGSFGGIGNEFAAEGSRGAQKGSGGQRKKKESRREMTQSGVAKVASNLTPELAKGVSSGTRTDVFLIAALAYHMLTGSPLLKGDNDFARMEDAAKWDASRLASAPVSTEWRKIFEKALSPDPGNRYADARELFGALEATFGRDAMQANPGWQTHVRAGGDGRMSLKALLDSGGFTEQAALVVTSWLAAAVGTIQESTGGGLTQLEPYDIRVDVTDGTVMIAGYESSAVLDKLKRWFRREEPPAGRDDFWK